MSKLEEYFEACNKLEKYMPAINMFVKAFAPEVNKVNVGNNTYTVRAGDGFDVYVKPFLGITHISDHDRARCDVLEGSQFACPACRTEDTIFYCVYHELSHLLYESFTEVKANASVIKRLNAAVMKHGTPELYAWISNRKPHFPKYAIDPYMIAGAFHPSFEHLIKAVEDIRVEGAISNAKPGFRKMSARYWNNLLEKGIYSEQHDETFSYNDLPLDAQVVFGSIVGSKEIDLTDSFDASVVDAVQQAKSAFLLRSNMNNITDALVRTFELVAFYHKLGFFSDLIPPEADPQDAPGDSSDEQQGSDGGQTKGDSGDNSDDTDQDSDDGDSSGNQDISKEKEGGTEHDNGGNNSPDNADSSDDVSDSSRSTGSGPVGPDDSDFDNSTDAGQNLSSASQPEDSGDNSDQAGGNISTPGGKVELTDDQIQKIIDDALHGKIEEVLENGNKSNLELETIKDAVEQYKVFDSPLRAISGREVITPEVYENKLARNGSRINYSKTPVAGSKLRARKVFAESRTDESETSLKSGRLNTRSLGARAFNDDERLFKRKIVQEGVEWDICIGMDLSASTRGHRNQDIREITMLTAELLYAVDVDFAVFGHTTGVYNGKGIKQIIIPLKDRKQRLTTKVREDILSVGTANGSLDGLNLEFYRKYMQKGSGFDHQMVIYFTDGHIPETNKQEQVPIVQREIENLKKLGIHLVVIAVDTDYPKTIGLDTVVVDSGQDLKTVMAEIEKRIVRGKKERR